MPGSETEVRSAWLCCSVGATWTVELRPADRAGRHTGPAGPVVDWICSGVPTELPAPEVDIGATLADRGLLLFPERPAGGRPRTRSRWLIGHVTRSSEVFGLALRLAELVDEPSDLPGQPGPRRAPHPMLLAAQWIDAGYSPDAAAGWVTAGITSPAAARDLLATELDQPDPLRVVPRQLVASTRWSDPS